MNIVVGSSIPFNSLELSLSGFLLLSYLEFRCPSKLRSSMPVRCPHTTITSRCSFPPLLPLHRFLRQSYRTAQSILCIYPSSPPNPAHPRPWPSPGPWPLPSPSLRALSGRRHKQQLTPCRSPRRHSHCFSLLAKVFLV